MSRNDPTSGNSDGAEAGLISNDELSSPNDDDELWLDNKLNPRAVTYTASKFNLKRNHPLMIMVNERRTDLLGHPLCSALIRLDVDQRSICLSV